MTTSRKHFHCYNPPFGERHQWGYENGAFAKFDVHKTWIYACIGITDTNNRTEYKQARFSLFSKGLQELAEWLAKYSCTEVCMKSSDKCWIPVFNILEMTYCITPAHPKYTKPQIRTVPGLSKEPLTAIRILSEIGADMSVFPTSKHMISWAGCCPRNDSSAQKVKSTKISRADSFLEPILVQIANALIKSKPP